MKGQHTVKTILQSQNHMFDYQSDEVIIVVANHLPAGKKYEDANIEAKKILFQSLVTEVTLRCKWRKWHYILELMIEACVVCCSCGSNKVEWKPCLLFSLGASIVFKEIFIPSAYSLRSKKHSLIWSYAVFKFFLHHINKNKAYQTYLG